MVKVSFAATAPVCVGRVGLKARDVEALAAYYKHLLGLVELGRSGSRIALGTPDRELLEIEGSLLLKPDDPRSAGLFHTAFLLPERADLARWTRFAMEERIGIEGASDHIVSEAIYLTDPEGNGIEIYADRAPESWTFDNGSIRMATERLNFDGLLGELRDGEACWKGAPEGTMIGHVHLRVGNAAQAERWWKDVMAFDTMAHYGDAAVFMATGGYHHHIGANNWRSRGTGKRDADRSGLGFVELISKRATEPGETVDPWGTVIRTVPG